MCGRYANHLKKMSGWGDILGNWPAESSMSMNIAPTQNIPVVSNDAGLPRTKVMRWGLVPHWSKTAKPAYATFNARAESVRQKPAFRDACAKAQTCLIPASGYYEWNGEKGHKSKYYIQSQDETPLMLAGLWAYWKQGELSLYSCTILTRSAVPSLADIHHRMPVILNRDDAKNWLCAAAIDINTQLNTLQGYNDYPLISELTV